MEPAVHRRGQLVFGGGDRLIASKGLVDSTRSITVLEEVQLYPPSGPKTNIKIANARSERREYTGLVHLNMRGGICTMCGGGVYGGGGPRPPVEDCRDEYELQLMDWQHIYPNASTIRSNIRVVLQKSYSDRTINVFLEDGIRIGTVFSLGLRNCMDKYRYDAVLLRRDGKLYVRAFKK